MVLCIPQLRPASVVFGVLLDFTNYDAEPPSVRVVDPWTKRPLRASELPTRLLRQLVAASPVVSPQAPPLSGEPAANGVVALGNAIPAVEGAMLTMAIQVAPLLQASTEDDVPFLCVPGVYEYHQHPAHTGDDWLLYRGRGEGTLDAILNVFHKYGVGPVVNFSYNVMIEPLRSPGGFAQRFIIQINGFECGSLPT